jgi:NADPH-dependent curcumin reductase CurA
VSGLRNRRWVVVGRPIGRALSPEDFRLEDAPLTPPGPDEVQMKTLVLSIDPAQKSWMENIAGYRRPVDIGGVMPSFGGGVVTASNHPGFAAGDLVTGEPGWQETVNLPGAELAKPTAGLPLETALSVLGPTGKTAYFGLLNIGKPRPGDTLVISGAAGATGSVVGQIGKLGGCRVIGIAGGREKCDWLVSELRFDGAIDYKNEKVRSRLRELCPNGIDVFFDNVGGDILDNALARINVGARVVICGGITRYNADPRDPLQMPPGPRNYFNVVFTGATIQSLLLGHFTDQFASAERRLAAWVADGSLRFKIDVLDGFEAAPRALMNLFEGRNFGKQLVRIGEPPA